MASWKRKIITGIIVILGIFIVAFLVYTNFFVGPSIKDIEITDSKRFDHQVIFNIEVDNYFWKFDKATWCLVSLENVVPSKDSSDWVMAKTGYCSFTIESGDYYVFVKDRYGNITTTDSKRVRIDKVIEVKTNKDEIYMWNGRQEKIKYELVKIGDVKDENVTYKSMDTNIATVTDDGVITGVGYGTTEVRVISEGGKYGSVKVYVSNFINKPEINFNKSYIGCEQFNEDEARLIDNILFDRIDDAGYKTRAGVVAAARFLAVEFAYRIHYFAENGRLNNYPPYKKVDGEGRYYHRGLYLARSKTKTITDPLVGPAPWGCKLKTFTELPQYIQGNFYPNGLDCSGFVTWALINGGFDVGDIGAGENAEHDDLDDLGEKAYITYDLMNSGKVKVGDLIGWNGHMAILAGWDDNNYYIAESLNTTAGVVITTVARNKLVGSDYKYIILMDNVYKEDGNLTNMW